MANLPSLFEDSDLSGLPAEDPGGGKPRLVNGQIVVGVFVEPVRVSGDQDIAGRKVFTHSDGIVVNHIDFADGPHLDTDTGGGFDAVVITSDDGIQLNSRSIQDLNGGPYLRKVADTGFAIFTHDGTTPATFACGALNCNGVGILGGVALAGWNYTQVVCTGNWGGAGLFLTEVDTYKGVYGTYLDGGIQYGVNRNGKTILLNISGNGLLLGAVSSIEIGVGDALAGKFDDSAVAGDTRFQVYDVTAGTLKRVSVGAADSAGAGFRTLRVVN